MMENLKKELTCTRCEKVVETYSEIVYSQGSKVCFECKKVSQASDNAAFDRDMALRRVD
jgi:hypothetical protein